LGVLRLAAEESAMTCRRQIVFSNRIITVLAANGQDIQVFAVTQADFAA